MPRLVYRPGQRSLRPVTAAGRCLSKPPCAGNQRRDGYTARWLQQGDLRGLAPFVVAPVLLPAFPYVGRKLHYCMPYSLRSNMNEEGGWRRRQGGKWKAVRDDPRQEAIVERPPNLAGARTFETSQNEADLMMYLVGLVGSPPADSRRPLVC